MRATPPRKTTDWISTLESTTERYLTSDIHGARSALLDAETLLRSAGSDITQSSFALAVILAKRSEIEASLGDSQAASSLLDEALRLFQNDPLAVRGGLLTPEAVRTFVRQQDAESHVKWRQQTYDAQ